MHDSQWVLLLRMSSLMTGHRHVTNLEYICLMYSIFSMLSLFGWLGCWDCRRCRRSYNNCIWICCYDFMMLYKHFDHVRQMHPSVWMAEKAFRQLKSSLKVQFPTRFQSLHHTQTIFGSAGWHIICQNYVIRPTYIMGRTCAKFSSFFFFFL